MTHAPLARQNLDFYQAADREKENVKETKSQTFSLEPQRLDHQPSIIAAQLFYVLLEESSLAVLIVDGHKPSTILHI